MNPEDIILSELSQSQRTNTVYFHLYEVPSVVKSIETESQIMVTRGWRERGRGTVAYGYRSDLQDKVLDSEHI